MALEERTRLLLGDSGVEKLKNANISSMMTLYLNQNFQ